MPCRAASPSIAGPARDAPKNHGQMPASTGTFALCMSVDHCRTITQAHATFRKFEHPSGVGQDMDMTRKLRSYMPAQNSGGT